MQYIEKAESAQLVSYVAVCLVFRFKFFVRHGLGQKVMLEKSQVQVIYRRIQAGRSVKRFHIGAALFHEDVLVIAFIHFNLFDSHRRLWLDIPVCSDSGDILQQGIGGIDTLYLTVVKDSKE